ncbi:unnamed protein product [Brassicogethes aeneus]|uniref:PDZ and LIM domain protein Zasp n=1 Tax=Brassicogethes aeneus TaxID=1431903 RepID=A0A9P0FH09_BRAAE|nr:unnamed protein product [Brassicogethes aeneus]
MASIITVRLNKDSSPNWGFRLQGGKDFGTPLIIQKITSGTPAERAGLIPGDSVIKINNVDVFNLRHKDAQDVVVRAGNNFDMTIQRGGSTWKPQVIPTGTYTTHSPNINNLSPVTKTSLHAQPGENIGAIGTGHNLSAKPFGPQLNGSVNEGSKLVNKQYNTPLKLYSEQSIAETLSAQTEVLSTGALGVNFKKNEKDYDASKSAVFHMLKEAENEPKGQEEPDSGIVTLPNSGIAGLRHVMAPENKPKPPTPQLPPGQNICADCERLIVGVFVRIKDKNLHVECFKCATCGSSLKNVGYYNINNKLYCDIHAKSAAINNPPAPNLVPVTVQPGGKIPADAISAALSTHSLSTPSPLSPKGNSFASPYQSGGNISVPKPFSSVSAPLSPHNTLPRGAPLSPRSPISNPPAPSFSPASSADCSVQNIVWPPFQEEQELPTACPLFYPPPSQVEAQILAKRAELERNEYSDLEIEEMAYYQQPKMSLCSEEVTAFTERKSATECIETISESLETHKLVENVLKTRPRSPPPLDTKILSCPESIARNITCCQGTDSSCELKRPTQYKPNTLECQNPGQVPNPVPQGWESSMLQALKTSSDTFSQIPSKHSSSAFASALKIAPSEPFTATMNILEPVPFPEMTEPYFPPEHSIITETPLEPKAKPEKKSESLFVKALVIAPDRPFTPVGGAAPIKKKEEDPIDRFIKELPKPAEKLTMRTALTTAPERPYTPLLTESVTTKEMIQESKMDKYTVDKTKLTKPMAPAILPPTFHAPQPETKVIIKQMPPIIIQETKEREFKDEKDTKHVRIIEKKELKSAVPATISKNRIESEEPAVAVSANFPPIFQGFSCSFQNKTDHSQFSVEVITSPPTLTPTPTEKSHSSTSLPISEGKSEFIQTENLRKETTFKKQSSEKTAKTTVTSQPTEIVRQDEQVIVKKPLPLASSLHPVGGKIPQYQVNISDEAEAEIRRMEKMEKAQIRMEQQKSLQREEAQVKTTLPAAQPPVETLRKPIITIQPGDTQPMRSQLFKPVIEETPSSNTLSSRPRSSPRPRSLTPSMVSKPPAVLPYYQSNLVAHQCPPASVNLLDPRSRSPSPCPMARERSPSPLPGGAGVSSVRPKSPAAGPPPNPLQSSCPLPQPIDLKVRQAKESLSTFIPQYKEKRDLVEMAQGMDFYKRTEELTQNIEQEQTIQTTPVSLPMKPPMQAPMQMYTSQVQMQNYTIPQAQIIQQSCITSQESCGSNICQKSMQIQNLDLQNLQSSHSTVSQTAEGSVATLTSNRSHQAQLDDMRKKQSQSVNICEDGKTQVQRKTMVTEEYERIQKEQVIEIEKSVTTTKKHPFRDVKPPTVDQPGIMGLHVTNPQPLSSPFIRADTLGDLTQVPAPNSNLICPPCTKTPPSCLQQAKPSEPAQPSLAPPPPPIRTVFAPGSQGPIKHVKGPGSQKPSQNVTIPNIPSSDVGTGSGRQTGAIGGPKRGRGILNAAAIGGARIPLCGQCHKQVRGPFITALGKIWCPDHFVCATPSCRRPLQDIGFVEERGQLYCEYCFEQYLAPPCSKCNGKIKADCLKAIGKNFHPECFNCVYCGKLFGNSPFFLEDGSPYCEADWNELFTTKCFACGFPVEAGDRWVEALNNNYHSQCFNCTMCKKNLEGQSFFAKGGRPFCKNHAR